MGLLTVTVVLSPLAVVAILLFAFFVPVIAFEGASAVASLRRSASLVRHRILKTALLLATSILVAGALGPLLGTILILLTGAPFPLANIVAGVTYAVLMPYVGLTVAYLYFDARIRSELARDEVRVADVLPAEISWSRSASLAARDDEQAHAVGDGALDEPVLQPDLDRGRPAPRGG